MYCPYVVLGIEIFLDERNLSIFRQYMNECIHEENIKIALCIYCTEIRCFTTRLFLK